MKTINRRSFIQETAKASAAAMLVSGFPLGHSAAAKRTKMTINLVCGAIGVSARTQADVNALAVKHGFESVEARGTELAVMSQGQIDDLLGDMKEKNITFGASGFPVDFRGSDAQFSGGIKEFPNFAKGIRRAGVDRVSTWISPGSGSMPYVQNFRQHAARLREVAKVLKDHGHRLGLEYVGTHTSLIRSKYPFVHTMAEMKELIAEIGTGNVGFVMDSWHWWQAQDSEGDILTLTNHDIVAADLNDAPAGKKREEQLDNQRELPMATGVIDLAAFLNAMNKIGYDGPVRAEPFNAPLRQLDKDAACAATSAAMKKAFALIT
ncbi:MAG: sugar phosphate isomerase/epimerase [Verrucomicrobia bacterium]|nr:sugar phosphate isomerase/epimerase [Verrucomicrobiota bacterium]